MKLTIPGLILAISTFLCLPLAAVQAEPLYSSGHGDIGLAYEDDGLFLHYHLGSGAVVGGVAIPDEGEFEPDTIYTEVANSYAADLTSDLTFVGDLIGKSGSDTFYVLTSASNPGTPHLGLGSEELDGTWSDVSVQMVGFSYEGSAIDPQFASARNVFPTGLQGEFQTLGNGPGDYGVITPYPVHDHAYWAFTDPGLYELTLFASGTSSIYGYQTDTATFSFVVGGYEPPPVSPVPEPTSLALFGIGAVGAVVVGRNRRKKNKQDA